MTDFGAGCVQLWIVLLTTWGTLLWELKKQTKKQQLALKKGGLMCLQSELQIRGDIEDNSRYSFLFLNENIHCDPSLEMS